MGDKIKALTQEKRSLKNLLNTEITTEEDLEVMKLKVNKNYENVKIIANTRRQYHQNFAQQMKQNLENKRGVQKNTPITKSYKKLINIEKFLNCNKDIFQGLCTYSVSKLKLT